MLLAFLNILNYIGLFILWKIYIFFNFRVEKQYDEKENI